MNKDNTEINKQKKIVETKKSPTIKNNYGNGWRDAAEDLLVFEGSIF